MEGKEAWKSIRGDEKYPFLVKLSGQSAADAGGPNDRTCMSLGASSATPGSQISSTRASLGLGLGLGLLTEGTERWDLC